MLIMKNIREKLRNISESEPTKHVVKELVDLFSEFFDRYEKLEQENQKLHLENQQLRLENQQLRLENQKLKQEIRRHGWNIYSSTTSERIRIIRRTT